MKRNKEQMRYIKESVIGAKVINLYYEESENYYVMEFDNGAEVSFRFMSDICMEKIKSREKEKDKNNHFVIDGCSS